MPSGTGWPAASSDSLGMAYSNWNKFLRRIVIPAKGSFEKAEIASSPSSSNDKKRIPRSFHSFFWLKRFYWNDLARFCNPLMLGRFIFPLTFLRRGKIKLLYSNLQKESYTTKGFTGSVFVQVQLLSANLSNLTICHTAILERGKSNSSPWKECLHCSSLDNMISH